MAVEWDERFILKVYTWAQDGWTNKQIREQIGVSKTRFERWLSEHRALRIALKKGRKSGDLAVGKNGRPRAEGESLADFIYRRLPPRLRELWDRISKWDKDPSPQRRLDALFEKEGKMVRQHLFMYALVKRNFNPSAACRFVGISKTTLELWKADPDFSALMDEIRWHKENMIEAALFDLIRRKDPRAVIFASKTLNQDRGYAEKKIVETVGKVEHDVVHSYEEMPIKFRKQLMKYIEEGKQGALPEHVPDAEFTVTKPKGKARAKTKK